MLQPTTIARPYAVAIFKLAKQDKSSSVWQNALKELSSIIQIETVKKLIGNPKVNQKELLYLIKSLLTDLPEDFKQLDNFLDLILQNKRILLIPYIFECLEQLLVESSGSANILIESAFKINAEQKKSIVKRLETKFARKLNATVKVAPELIGGIKIFIGDEVIDYSVKAHLSSIKNHIIAH
jgi:F-type H+-transporting ATPase subunit delta